MINQNLIKHVNNTILKQASGLSYSVADLAPSNESELFSSPSLVVWSGASDQTIFNDSAVNYAFRALHDQLHLDTGLGFSVAHEIEMGKIQANQYEGALADLVYCEVALQAKHFQLTGDFVADQVKFTVENMQKGIIRI